ncbi:MAG: hypothetical protein U9P73_04175 [Candidatus Cloacimonadota bacterium]|nr:hypothetical protein [Candidatus Cloacimonadota bacterium]
MKKIISVILLAILLTFCGTTTEPNTNLDRPTDLDADCNYVQEVILSWNYENGDEVGFIIQRKTESEVYTIIDTIDAGIHEYSDVTVIVGTVYNYMVAAVCEECQSEWSDEVSVFVIEGFQSLDFGTDQTIEIVTWNIEHFPKNLSVTVEYTVQIMRGLNADIYALQEIESNSYFEDVISMLNIDDPENTWDGYRATSAYYSINLAYIYKSNQLQIDDIYEIYQDDWYAFPRSPLVMELSFNGNDLIIINNHLKAGGDNEDEARRLEACQKLDTYISENWFTSEVLLVGDLNDDITEPESSNVFWSFINEPLEYLFTDMEIAEGSSVYWSYPSWPSHLDHILITNELFDEFSLEGSDVQTLRIDLLLDGGWSEYDSNVSDHRPVGLKLAF